MIFLNLGCGGTRPTDLKWINIDALHTIFPNPRCPERVNMDAEPNYMNLDISKGLPFYNSTVDGILASHFLEHLTCIEAVRFLKECYRVLKKGGVVRISVPDASTFYNLTINNCSDWGEPLPILADTLTFMDYALFFEEHKQLITEDSLYCMFFSAGFRQYDKSEYKKSEAPGLEELDNRPIFSLFAEAIK